MAPVCSRQTPTLATPSPAARPLRRRPPDTRARPARLGAPLPSLTGLRPPRSPGNGKPRHGLGWAGLKRPGAARSPPLEPVVCVSPTDPAGGSGGDPALFGRRPRAGTAPQDSQLRSALLPLGTAPAGPGLPQPAVPGRQQRSRAALRARPRPSARPPPARGAAGPAPELPPPAGGEGGGKGGGGGGRLRCSGLCNRARSHRAPAAAGGGRERPGERGCRGAGGDGVTAPGRSETPQPPG